MSRPRVVVVAKRTPYQRFIDEEGDPRARLLLRRRDPAVSSWVRAHGEHVKTLETVERALERLGAQVLLVRRAHAAFDTSDAVLVVAVGGDGTLLAASHNVGSVPILGVNSAPAYSVGFFCGAERGDAREKLARALEGKLARVVLTRMSVKLNGRLRSRRVLNEALYAHSSPAATSRYILEVGRVREEQRSSGIWIGPAAGSTAAQRSAGGKVLPLHARELQLVVREPYTPKGKRYKISKALLGEAERARVYSKMDDASLFLDGPYRQIGVRLGDAVEFAVSDEPLTVLGLRVRRSR
jgi:NAD+ kinase